MRSFAWHPCHLTAAAWDLSWRSTDLQHVPVSHCCSRPFTQGELAGKPMQSAALRRLVLATWTRMRGQPILATVRSCTATTVPRLGGAPCGAALSPCRCRV